MACSAVMPPGLLPDLLLQIQKGPDYHTMVSDFVSKNKGKIYKLNRPAGATWTVGGLDGTIYKGDDEMVYEWGSYYLKEEVSMEVLGVVKGTSLPAEQLVLMTCEDRKMYIYGENELFLVAPSLQHLCERGINDNKPVTYDYGDAFKDKTNKDWDKVRKGPVGRQLDEKHHQLIMSLKDDMIKHLPKKA